MSVATELARIQTDRNTIRAKLVALGMADSTANLDTLAAAVEAIVDQGAVNVSIKEGESYTVPAGYHNGSGTVVAVGGSGSYTLQAKTVTPTKQQQSVAPDQGYYGLSAVTVGAIPANYQDVGSVTAGAADVLTGKVLVTADGTVTTGTMVNNGDVDVTLTGTVVTYTIPKGYHSGAGTIKIVLEDRTVTPTKAAQEITAAAGKVLGKVTVEAIPEAYQDVTGVTATGADVLEGKTIVSSTGERVAGAMTNNGAVSAAIDGLTTTSYTIPAGYHTGEGTVKLTDDIETSLAAI